MATIGENVEGNPKRKAMIISASVLILLIVFLVVLWIWGSRGMFFVFAATMAIVIFLAIGLLMAIIVIKLLFPPKVDMVHLVRKRIEQGAEMRKPDNPVSVFLSGDNRDFERKNLGLLQGMTRTILPADLKEVSIKNSKHPKAEDTKGLVKIKEKWYKPIGKAKEFYFVLVKGGTLGGAKVIGCLREDLSNPNMDSLYIKDTTLSPPFGGVYYPAKYDQDTRMIEKRLVDYVSKYALEDFLRDYKVIIDDAILSSPAHQKNLESKGALQRIGELGEER